MRQAKNVEVCFLLKNRYEFEMKCYTFEIHNKNSFLLLLLISFSCLIDDDEDVDDNEVKLMLFEAHIYYCT